MSELPEQQPGSLVPAASEARDPLSRLSLRQRLALGAAALVGPLVLVGAAAAADGDTPIDEPVETVATVLGIGGNSGDTRNDFENRSETAGDVGQPGSCPGAACDAPGLNQESEGEGEGEGETEEGETPEAVEEETPEAEVEGDGPAEDFDPHANGKGCDDVLFANGGPPFGGHDTPVGPCNKDEEEPAAEETPEAVEEETPETEGEGSNGNGYGHEKGRGAGHEKGQGEGHEKHGDGAGEAGGEDPATDTTDAGSDGPGNSGGKGKNQ